MGNCNCNYCPGGMPVPGHTDLKEFTHEVQAMIDQLREKNKNEFKTMKQYHLQNGRIFRGTLLKGKKSGYGQYHAGNNSYFGQFQDDYPQGEGLLVRSCKDFIKGVFVKGMPTGEVRQKINGCEFSGQYGEGKKVKGLLKTDTFTYEGSFKENKFHGYGVLEFTNGDKYEGDFSMGLYNGDGNYRTNDQGSYSGQFKGGLYDGKGVFVWRDNYLYQGEYRKGVRNGVGKFTGGSTQYEGYWVEGQPQGKDISSCQSKVGPSDGRGTGIVL